MIEFFSENEFTLDNEDSIIKWIDFIATQDGFSIGDVAYVFCDNEYLHKINLEYLNHDTYTDIISFDYSLGKQINGEIYISTEMVAENATELDIVFNDELLRVVIHGILHFMGNKDKTEAQTNKMRELEDKAILKYKTTFN